MDFVTFKRVDPTLPVLDALGAQVPVAVVDRDVEAELVQLVRLDLGLLDANGAPASEVGVVGAAVVDEGAVGLEGEEAVLPAVNVVGPFA